MTAHTPVPSIRRTLIAAALTIAALVLLAPSAHAALGVVGSFSGPGTGDGELATPKRVAIHDATGNAYVADRGNDRVQVFAADGRSATYLTQFGNGTLDDPYGIAIDQDTGAVYVSDATGITKFNSDGQSTPTLTVDGSFTDPGSANAPLAFDQAANELVVADPASDTVKRFTTSGAATGTPFNGSTSPGGAFTGLLDVAVDSTGNVIVIDNPTGNPDDVSANGQSRVERFKADGTYELTYGPIAGGSAVLTTDPDDDRVLIAGNTQLFASMDGRLTVEVFEADGTPVSTARLPAETTSSATFGLAAAGDGSDRVLAIADVSVWGSGGLSAHVLADVTPPTSAIEPTTDVAEFSAHVHGSVDPQGFPTTYRFEYSVDGSGEWASAGEQGPIEAAGDVEDTLTGLADDTTYDVRLVATNSGGSYTSGEDSFTTLPADPPVVTVEPATGISGAGASLAGSVDPEGHPATYRFEYKRIADSDWIAVPGGEGGVGDGSDPVPVSAELGGLAPNTPYEYRLVGTNGAGATPSGAETFTTDAVAPTAQTHAIVDRTSTTATLQGRVNPRNSQTDYWFEYGTDSTYGTQIPAVGEEADAGSGNVPVLVSLEVANLEPGTTYHYRLVARNAVGTVEGSDRTVTTAVSGAEPACPNAAIRAAQGSEHLPNCRAYEQVSPVDKNGYDAGLIGAMNSGYRVSPDGNRNAYGASGGFDSPSTGAGAGFMSTRGEPWTTTSLMLPSFPGAFEVFGTLVASDDLSRAVVTTNMDVETGEETPVIYYLMDTATGEVERLVPNPLSGPAGYVASNIVGSEDFGTVAYAMDAELTPDAVGVPGNKLYQFRDGELSLASVLPNGEPASGDLPFSTGGITPPFHPVSRDGEVIWFVSSDSGQPNLYRREGGETTLVTQPETAAPTEGFAPTMAGASPNGDRIFFVTTERLVDEDADNSPDVYLYEHSADPDSDDNLTLVSKNAGDPDATNQLDTGRLVIGSEDGSTVVFADYFQLVPGEPESADVKLYSWKDGDLHYVAGTSFSDNLVDRSLDYMSPDGRYLRFLTYATGVTPRDTNGHLLAYVYDRETGSVGCASCPLSGPSQGDAENLQNIQSYAFAQNLGRKMMDDGRAFFSTLDDLLPRDANGKRDVYTWKDGKLDLISSGQSDKPTYLDEADASGDTVSFRTVDQLVGWDRDRLYDVYVARVGGGLAEPEPGEIPCSEDECQRPATGRPSLERPGSADLERPDDSDGSRASFAPAGLSKAARAKLARGERIALRVRVSRAGRVSVTGRARIGKRTLTVARGSARASRAGSVRVALRLSKAARQRLAAGRSLRLTLAVRFTGAPAAKKLSLNLRRASSSEGRAK